MVELLGDHLFHELKLLHPHWTRHFDEQRTVANFFRLRIARNSFADDIAPDGPNAVFIEPSREIKPAERFVQKLANDVYGRRFFRPGCHDATLAEVNRRNQPQIDRWRSCATSKLGEKSGQKPRRKICIDKLSVCF
jgi:hypothetical protein